MARRRTVSRYVLCVKNHGYAASLEKRKIYVAVPDKIAEARGYIRVIDESGEDYLFPANRFVPIEVPQEARSAFAGVA
jgi:hypothetical protein